jgi:exo-poly-alpha-galacturonosidase
MRTQLSPSYITIKSMLLCMATSLIATTPQVSAAPLNKPAPQQLHVPTLSADDSSLMLVWKAPEDTGDIVDYRDQQ